MKAIQPVNIWAGGQNVQANNLDMYIVNDNLSSSATFYYQLLSVTTDGEVNTSSQSLVQGNLIMDGTDYENWGNSGDINNAAYVWAAGQLNLTLV
jgi:hypothetical protein